MSLRAVDDRFYIEGGRLELMGKACVNFVFYNLCGLVVGWIKRGICDLRVLNRVRDCVFLYLGKWFI